MAPVAFSHVTKRFENDTVAVSDLTLEVSEGEFLILVGPSGCGKTTALRMTAGLEQVTSGEIRIGDHLVNDVEPSRRDVAMVFQSYALYPHMTVFENLSFPLRQQKVRKAEIKQRVNEVARLLGIDELLARRPRELSGGQRQRVAIGRALVRRPQAFLMDEPLSNLDAKLRVQMRTELISLRQRIGVTTLYVTHDQTEAMTLGDRVVVMNKGIVQQVDAPERLYRHPRNTFVAGFIGSPAMNFLEGRIEGGNLYLGDHRVALPETLIRQLSRRQGQVIVGLRPEDFLLDGGAGDGIPATVAISERLGPEVLAHLKAEGLQLASLPSDDEGDEGQEPGDLTDTITARFDPAFTGSTGAKVHLRPNLERLQLFDPDTGDSLTAT